MAGSLNKVMIIGNVGRDPEMRYLQDGTPMTSFSVATSRSWTTPDGDRREETDWFNVVAWRKLAETCNQFVAKGRKVYIEGRLQTRSWEGQDGQKHYRTEVIAQQMILLDRRPGTGGPPDDISQRPPTEPEGVIEPDDLPF